MAEVFPATHYIRVSRAIYLRGEGPVALLPELALLLVTLPFVLASLAVGVFVSALARASAQAVFISVFFILPSFVLSGVMFPYEFMPHGVREIGGLFPLRWYQIALRLVVERGATLGQVAVPVLMLTGFFSLALGAIRWRLKPRLD